MGVGWSHFRISNLWSVTVDQIKKFKKQSPSIFEFCFWGDQSTGPQPIQLVLSPFNWFPKTVFYRNLSIGRSNKKNSKNLVHLFSYFDSGRTSQLVPNPFNWSPTHSTGPQKLFFYRNLSIGRSNQKNSKTQSIYFRILILGGP